MHSLVFPAKSTLTPQHSQSRSANAMQPRCCSSVPELGGWGWHCSHATPNTRRPRGKQGSPRQTALWPETLSAERQEKRHSNYASQLMDHEVKCLSPVASASTEEERSKAKTTYAHPRTCPCFYSCFLEQRNARMCHRCTRKPQRWRSSISVLSLPNSCAASDSKGTSLLGQGQLCTLKQSYTLRTHARTNV